jgi:hypothetical protein
MDYIGKEQIVLIKGVDKTNDISFIKRDLSKGYIVKFKGNDKVFIYSFHNVQVLDKPINIDLSKTTIYHNNTRFSNVKRAMKFNNIIVKIIFENDKQSVYHINELKFLNKFTNKSVDKDVFNYLKKLASIVSVKVEDKALLAEQIEKVDINEDTVLYDYILKKTPIKSKGYPRYIFPFGINISQSIAVKNAFTSNISIIEGPPGTGKTQTILNIIANAIVNNKTVAVVSNNNAATENVLDKLKRTILIFLRPF